MKKESPAYTEHLLALFTEVLNETITERPLQEVSAEMTPSLAHGLQFVSQHGLCSVRDVARGLSMTLPAASQLVDRLVKKDWVTRSDNKDDRRLSEILLTETGRDLAEQIRSRRIARMSRILDRMDPDCRRTLVASLESFIAAGIHDADSALETCSHCGVDHDPECVVNEVYRAATGAQIERT